MNVLITGGAGFLGSHLADRLLAEGHSVAVIDNYATGHPRNLQSHPKLLVREGTIADPVHVNRFFEEFKPTVVVHAAASYKDPENWLEDSLTNVAGTANVVKASQKAKIERLIYFQTALCYGLKPLEQPITLNHVINPQGSSYAITKTAGEYFVLLSGLNAQSFRLANMYGPRNISGPLPTFFSRLTTGKPCFVMDTRRDFVFVDDWVDAVMMAVRGKGQPGVYHLSTGKDYSIKELFDGTIKALGLKLDKEVEVRPRNPDDAFSILLDPTRTYEQFGWRASTPLEVGIEKTIRWYKEHGITATYTHLKPAEGAAKR